MILIIAGIYTIIFYTRNYQNEVLKRQKTILKIFYATWCKPCKVVSPIIEEVSQENEMVKSVKIDIDKEKDIAR
jgi:thioredoxin 1